MVAATRSKVCNVPGAPAPRRTGSAAPSLLRFSSDQFSSTAVSRSLLNYTCLVNKSVGPEDYGEAYAVKRKVAGCRPGRQNPGYRPCLRYSDLPDDDINGSIVDFRAGSHSEAPLEPQNIRRDSGGTADVATSSCQTIKPLAPTLKFGMYAGRVKANPLKYLATVLRTKLQPHAESCNLLAVATEIHNEAKNKHNTTLRRIYDVVNVLEAAGLLERSNGHQKRRSSRSRGTNECATCSNTKTGRSQSPECSKSGEENVGSAFECYDEEIEIHAGSSTKTDLAFTAKPENATADKKASRGSRIRWLDSDAERDHKQSLGRLAEEKIAADLRILEKQLEFETLQEELRLTTELIKHNQSRTVQSDSFESDVSIPCTPPPEDLSSSFLNFDDCTPTSGETELSPHPNKLVPAFGSAAMYVDKLTMCGSTSSPCISPHFDPRFDNPSMITEGDLNFWYNQSAGEVDMDILEANEQYQSNGLPLAISGTAQRGLNVPFVILQTNNSTNVDIELDGDVARKVYIVLDNEYQLYDYRELLSSMFPDNGREGRFRYTNASDKGVIQGSH